MTGIDELLNTNDDDRKIRRYNRQGALYVCLSAALFASTIFPGLRQKRTEAIQKATYVMTTRSFEKEPISKKLEMEASALADGADNLVRLSGAYGVGCGILLSPYELVTAHHVVAEAYKDNSAIYIQSQSYLGMDKSISMVLDTSNYKFEAQNDIGKIYLDKPVHGAKTLSINDQTDFSTDPAIINVAYKNKRLYHQIGQVERSYNNGTYFLGNINVGPGHSGSPIFNGEEELVGITSQAIMRVVHNIGKYDNGPIIFTNIGNPVGNQLPAQQINP